MKAIIQNDKIIHSEGFNKKQLIMLQFKVWLIGLYAKMSARIWVLKWRFSTAIWFFKRAIEAMRGKIMVVDSQEVYSNGGYKYYQMNISQAPFNNNADYSRFQ